MSSFKMTGRWRKGCWNQLRRGRGSWERRGRQKVSRGRWLSAPAAGPFPALPRGSSPSPLRPHPIPLFVGIAFSPPPRPPRPATAEMTVWCCRGVMVLPLD
ncbi:hypothetical protein CapIbe_022989 [Capra ibex]